MLKNPLVRRALLHVIGWSAVLAAGASGLAWLSQRPMFAMQPVELEVAPGHPLRHVNQAIVRAALPRSVYSSFFTTDLDAVQKSLQATPWVRTVAVRRVWPNRIVAAVTEYDLLGVWGEDRLISPSGEVFAANVAEAEEDGPLPSLSGPAGSEKEMVARLSDLRTWLAPLKLAPVAVEMSARHGWSMTLESGVKVQLGTAETRAELKNRIDRFNILYPKVTERFGDRVESIDLRYRNGLAVKAAPLEKVADTPAKEPSNDL